MKAVLSILFTISLLCSAVLEKESITMLPNGDAVLLTQGNASFTQTDSSAAIVTQSAEFWITGSQGKTELIVPSGILRFFGNSHIYVRGDSTHIQVFKGFVRFTATGGTPGETISAGYERLFSKVEALKPRSIISNAIWESFCSSRTDLRAFGCEDTPEDTSDQQKRYTELPKQPLTIRIHPTTFTRDLQFLQDSLAPHISLEKIFRESDSSTIVIQEQVNFKEIYTLKSESTTPFFIVDLHISRDIAPQKFILHISRYDSRDQSTKTKELSTTLTPSFATNSKSMYYQVPLATMSLVKEFITGTE